MRRPPLAVLFLFALSALLLVIFGQLVWRKADRPAAPQSAVAKRTSPEVTVADPARGGNAPDAPTLVVFGDYQCPACRDLENELAIVARERPDVRIVWKNVPIVTQHPQAQNAAEAALCAGRQGKFWDYHDQLMQNTISADPLFYTDIGVGLGLNADTFAQCLETHATAPLIQRTIEEALALNLNGVPAVFLNGQLLSNARNSSSILGQIPLEP